MKMILNDLLNLFFPRLCLSCKTPLVDGEDQLCLKCLCDLPYTGFDYLSDNPTLQLFTGKVFICHATALMHFEKGGRVQQLIHSLKYYDKKELGITLGRLAIQTYCPAICSDMPDLILPVPLHPKKKKQRGYNQSEWIAQGICAQLPLPIDTTSLRRYNPTDTQTQKQIFERWQNVQEAFYVANTEALKNKHILLIDDVITTGSTLEACARALLTVPGVRVSVLAIATV